MTKFNILSTDEGISLEGTSLTLKGNDVRRLLKDCREGYLFCATLGLNVDKWIRGRQIRDMSSAVIADSIASSAIEGVCNDICDELEKELNKSGMYLTDRFSPGYGDLPFSQQRDTSIIQKNRA